MTASEELAVVLLSVYVFSVVWLVLDVLLGHSRGAAKMRAGGMTTWELVGMSVGWPILMVLPCLTWLVMEAREAVGVVRALAVVAWEEIFGRGRP